MANYQELKSQAEDLMRQAEAARKAEIGAAIAEIKAKMAMYGITLEDLGGKAPKWLAALESAGLKRAEFAISGA